MNSLKTILSAVIAFPFGWGLGWVLHLAFPVSPILFGVGFAVVILLVAALSGNGPSVAEVASARNCKVFLDPGDVSTVHTVCGRRSIDEE